ncbi:MAG: hypothetical protein ACOYL9_14610, partial [Ilumatobacteraceae bacterium]
MALDLIETLELHGSGHVHRGSELHFHLLHAACRGSHLLVEVGLGVRDVRSDDLDVVSCCEGLVTDRLDRRRVDTSDARGDSRTLASIWGESRFTCHVSEHFKGAMLHVVVCYCYCLNL